MNKYCLVKALFVGGAGYVMGVGLAVFMNALEFFKKISRSRY